jgi:hypothetical protein
MENGRRPSSGRNLLDFCSCRKNNETPASEIRFTDIAITGGQEAPNPVTTQATGTFQGTYNKDTNVLTYSITYANVTPTNMHFHKGAPGVAGPVEIGIGSPPYSSPVNGTANLSEAQEVDLLAGNWYVNIHSSAYPAGEIRGQIIR